MRNAPEITMEGAGFREVKLVRKGSFRVAVPVEPSDALTEETVERVRNELREPND